MTKPPLDQDFSAPDIDDIRDAAKAMCGIAIRTPLLENSEVNAMLGGRLLIKHEGTQRIGAFKFRGAYNRIRLLTDEQKQRGVVTYSSGNHAQGVARSAQIFGTKALIVMPDDVPQKKMNATLALGAEIVTFDRLTQDNEDIVEAIRQETGRVVVPPSEDRRVMAGGGTVALEILEQANGPIDAVLTPCGSGGLTAATAIVMNNLSPDTDVYAVEPELFDDTRLSLIAGKRVAIPKGRKTICDAIMTLMPHALPFSVNVDLLAGGLVVSDDEVRHAMLFAFEKFKIVAEPGASVGLAAILAGKIDITGKTIATVISGGNVELAAYCAALSAAKEKE